MTQRADFDKIDLYLIRVLHTLITERSVSRAALRLHSTHPPVSAQLKRLRELTGDPLLVRAGNGMSPTGPRCALVAPATNLLHEAERLFGPRSRTHAFDADRQAAMFRIAASDYLDPLFLPHLVGAHQARRARRAPRADAADRRVRLPAHLATGDVDLVIGNWLEPPEELHLGKLFSDEIVCLVADDHPVARSAAGAAGRPSDTSAASTSRRRPCTPGARGVIDEHLEKLGLDAQHRRAQRPLQPDPADGRATACWC